MPSHRCPPPTDAIPKNLQAVKNVTLSGKVITVSYVDGSADQLITLPGARLAATAALAQRQPPASRSALPLAPVLTHSIP
jgi:hypothetical protein